MIKFHDFRHQNEDNSIATFVKKLKKKNLSIYELQVTNIVDAMISEILKPFLKKIS